MRKLAAPSGAAFFALKGGIKVGRNRKEDIGNIGILPNYPNMTREQKDLAETIAKANGGRVMFNITSAAKIAGRCRTTFPAWLHCHGVMVQKSGKDKWVNANDLAIALFKDRVSPL